MPSSPASSGPAQAAVLAYFSEVRAIHASGAGVAETSSYPAISNLLTNLGGTLKPKVRAIIYLQNRGAGIPDGGLFDASQLQGGAEVPGQLPSRGALEVKSPAEAVADIATGKQVNRCLALYGLVLVTNLRGFALYDLYVGQPRLLESCELAANAASFWGGVASPPTFAQAHADGLSEFLTRAIQARAPLTTPESVAWFLASYACEARTRLEGTPLAALASLKAALSEALDLNFTGEQGERFFRATLVQTLWYGMFSAWVLPIRVPDAAPFNWRTAACDLHLPAMQRLFSDLANPSAQHSLNLTDLLDRTAATLERVQMTEFGARFQSGDAVQSFYEPFLAVYDPELRKQFGVWCTPPEVVRYMVERVDRALKRDLKLPLGRADQSVYVLDPATGTGSYLTAALERNYDTLKVNADDALADDLRDAVKRRLIGFEIMPAPSVIAHMRLSLQLARYGASLRGEHDPAIPPAQNGSRRAERAAVYLTNALTNWADTPPRLNYPELQAEQDAAQHVKKSAPILVVMGNPPYSAFVGTSQAEEGDLIATYKQGLVQEWGIKKFNLDDLYVRFFRVAERKISASGRGIVSYISPYSYLSDPSYVVMRRTLLGEFDSLSFDNLNGDSRETGEQTPGGQPDPSIFSTAVNPAGIRVGTAIGLMVRRGPRSPGSPAPVVQYREFWGAGKAQQLLDALKTGGPTYAQAQPEARNRFSFRPDTSTVEYQEWPSVVELAGEAPINGLMEKRGGGLIGISRTEIEEKMQIYFDTKLEWPQLVSTGVGLSQNAARFDAQSTRQRLLLAGFDSQTIVSYFVRPFEIRWAYYSPIRPLWNEPRPVLWQQLPDNSFFVTCPAAAASDEGVPFAFTTKLGDNDALRGHAYYFPVFWNEPTVAVPNGLFDAPATPIRRANLSPRARVYLASLGAPNPDTDPATAALLWHHALAVGFSAAYLAQHAGGIAADWPRVPLPGTLEVLRASAALGARVAALLDDPQADTPPEVAGVGRLTRTDAETAAAQGYEVRAEWGALQRGHAVMPGRGRVALRAAVNLDERLGTQVADIALNDGWSWTGVPLAAWQYTIGGYQVMNKWLSYREFGVLGRALTLDEAREVSGMARRLSALVLLRAELDASYRQASDAAVVWSAVAWADKERTPDQVNSSGTRVYLSP